MTLPATHPDGDHAPLPTIPEAPPAPVARPSRASRLRRLRRLLPALGIVLLVLLSSGTSLQNGFAYDDVHIISENPTVKKPAGWFRYFSQPYWPGKVAASLYRPLTVIGFAAQWKLGGGSPRLFHVVNVVLYTACSLAVFWLATLLLPPIAAWLVAALFAVHPVHVEAVGNIVGQAELAAATALLSATAIYIRSRRDGRVPGVGASLAMLALYAVACLVKEHGIVLPGLIAAAELTVVRDPRPWRDRVRTLRPLALALLMVGLAYLGVRSRNVSGLVGDVPHPAFIDLSTGRRWLTMLGVVPEWVRLLVWPAHLAADYSPPHIPIRDSLDVASAVGALLLAAVFALAVALFRRAPVAAFGIFWVVVTLAPVSNFLFPTGIMLAERTLFLPSVGFLLVVGSAVPWLIDALREQRPATRWLVVAAAAMLLAAGAWRSADRQRVWKDNDAIFGSLIEDSPLNFKSHFAYGGMQFVKGDYKTGEREWRIAIALLPEFAGVYVELGNKYREAHFCEPAIEVYRKALAIEPGRAMARAGLAACLLELAQFEEARSQARRGFAYGQVPETFRYVSRVADSVIVFRRDSAARARR